MKKSAMAFKRPSWDEFFMFQAISCATRHSCLKRGVGAVLVKDKRIIGTGYNGAASGIKSCLELGYCYYEQLAAHEAKTNGKDMAVLKEQLKIFCQAVHAEMNALSQCSRDETKGSTLYITNYPCPKCVNDGLATNGVVAVRVWKEYLHNYTLTIDEKRAADKKLLEKGISVNYVHMSEKRIMEIASYMAKSVGERTAYCFHQ